MQLSHFELESLRQPPLQEIVPDDQDIQAMLRAGRDYVFAVAQLCIDRGGKPTTVELTERSGFGGYDLKLLAMMRAWRYTPVERDGEAKDACGPVAFMVHPALQLVTVTDSGSRAVFVGRELFPSASRSGVKVHYDGKEIDVRLARHVESEAVDEEANYILLSDYAGFELMLRADPKDLAWVLNAPALLAPTFDAARRTSSSGTPGLGLKAGSPVRVLGRKSWLSRVQSLEDAKITGWVPSQIVQKRYLAGSFGGAPSGDEQRSLAGRTALRDRPRGKVVMKLPAKRDLFHAEVLERRGDQALVVVDEPHWWALGWVEVKRLLPPTRRGSPDSDSRDRATFAVPQGAILFDQPRGKAIGRANRRTRAEALRVKHGYTEIDLVLDGLHVTAWVVTPSGEESR
ncbi:MAG: hypothetical protein R3B48_30165 [Kofleriaceae bacterium]